MGMEPTPTRYRGRGLTTRPDRTSTRMAVHSSWVLEKTMGQM